jgi:hypothetical protein
MAKIKAALRVDKIHSAFGKFKLINDIEYIKVFREVDE